jgi:hypothetical protein
LSGVKGYGGGTVGSERHGTPTACDVRLGFYLNVAITVKQCGMIIAEELWRAIRP